MCVNLQYIFFCSDLNRKRTRRMWVTRLKQVDSLIYFTIFMFYGWFPFWRQAWQFDNYKGNPISAAYLC